MPKIFHVWKKVLWGGQTLNNSTLEETEKSCQEVTAFQINSILIFGLSTYDQALAKKENTTTRYIG